MISSQKPWPLDPEAGPIEEYNVPEFLFKVNWTDSAIKAYERREIKELIYS